STPFSSAPAASWMSTSTRVPARRESMTAVPLPLTVAISERLSGHPFVALLDVDGTLAPIAPRPEQAAVPETTRRVVAELVALPNTVVAIVSGRAAADAANIVGVPGVWTIGNHGLETGVPNETPQPRQDLGRFEDAMRAALEETRAFAAAHGGVIVEDKR